ncbi:hypothetical protein Q3G72_009009 [Acer saccharum]|nr:hypothetical protein Q3G72_009009 [Acer saccharum]
METKADGELVRREARTSTVKWIRKGTICDRVGVLWDRANSGRNWYEGVDRKRCVIWDRATGIEMAVGTGTKDGSEKVRFGVEQ